MQYTAFNEHELAAFVEGIVSRAVEKTIKQITVTPEVMDKKQLAAYWQVSLATIDRRMKSGLPYKKINGGSPRFYRRECDEWQSISAGTKSQ